MPNSGHSHASPCVPRHDIRQDIPNGRGMTPVSQTGPEGLEGSYASDSSEARPQSGAGKALADQCRAGQCRAGQMHAWQEHAGKMDAAPKNLDHVNADEASAGPPERPAPAAGSSIAAGLAALPASCWTPSPCLADPTVREGALRAWDLAASHGRLLFLTVFGSALYGTALPGRSDLDLRGVYAACDPEGAERAPGLHWSSGTDGARNTQGDCDIDLVSLERWLLAELPAGDTGALDLLFAPSHAACSLFSDPLLAPVFARPLAFLRLEDGSACEAYVLKQGKKYGLEGTRLGGLWRMARFLEDVDPRARLGGFLEELVQRAKAPAFCFVDGEGALSAGGKIFEPTIRASEARRRLHAMLKGHSERIGEAREGRGVDWKALSHGLRAIRQQEELLDEGTLRFPLGFRDEVLAVKTAQHGFDAVEAMLTQGLARLKALREGSRFTGTHDPAYARSAVAAVREGMPAAPVQR